MLGESQKTRQQQHSFARDRYSSVLEQQSDRDRPVYVVNDRSAQKIENVVGHMQEARGAETD